MSSRVHSSITLRASSSLEAQWKQTNKQKPNNHDSWHHGAIEDRRMSMGGQAPATRPVFNPLEARLGTSPPLYSAVTGSPHLAFSPRPCDWIGRLCCLSPDPPGSVFDAGTFRSRSCWKQLQPEAVAQHLNSKTKWGEKKWRSCLVSD